MLGLNINLISYYDISNEYISYLIAVDWVLTLDYIKSNLIDVHNIYEVFSYFFWNSVEDKKTKEKFKHVTKLWHSNCMA